MNPTMKPTRKCLLSLIVSLAGLAALGAAPAAAAIREPDAVFYGTLTFDGVPLPSWM